MLRSLLFLLISIAGFPAIAGTNVATSALAACIHALEGPGRTIQLSRNYSVELTSSEALYRGNLLHIWDWDMEDLDQTYWTISDSFLAREFTPSPIGSRHQLSNGSKIFIFDKKGEVVISGYYGEKNFRPTLYGEPELRTPILESPQFQTLFYRQYSAAAIVELNELERLILTKQFEVFRPLYLEHKQNEKRFIAVGSKIIERAHFEGAAFGKLEMKMTSAPELHPDEEAAYGEMLFGLDLQFFMENGRPVVMQTGDRLFLIDDNGLTSPELRIGSPDAPLYGTLSHLKRFMAQVRSSRSAVLFQNPVIR